MRADLFELANVSLLLFFGSKQRPDLGDLFPSDVKQPRSFRRVQPFVKRRSEVVTIQIPLLEIELGERVRAVDDRFNATRSRHFADGFDRSDLTGDVHLVSNLN